jgi:hypothetical protein
VNGSQNSFINSLNKLTENDSRGNRKILSAEFKTTLLYKFERGAEEKQRGTYKWAKSHFRSAEETGRFLTEKPGP